MNWLKNFMQGRYGTDHLTIGLLFAFIFCSFLGTIMRWSFFEMLSWLVLLVAGIRVFSRNIPKRYEENRKFMNFWTPIQRKFALNWQRIKDFPKYRYFKCPNCGQNLRVPRGKGTINISCSRCKNMFVRKS